jgi:hypothetical protein
MGTTILHAANEEYWCEAIKLGAEREIIAAVSRPTRNRL